MIIIVGWCVLRASRDAYTNASLENIDLIDDDIYDADKKLWATFREWMASNGHPFLIWSLHEHNNNHKGMLQVYLSRNHRGMPFWDMLDWIKENGPSSYGLFYVNDDEISETSGNEFRVYRLMNAKIEEMSDPFFGNIEPNLEPLHPYDRYLDDEGADK